MERETTNRLELNTGGITLIIFSLFIAAKIGIVNVVSIFVAIVMGMIAGTVIGIGIISLIGIGIFFGYQLASSILDEERIIKPPTFYANKFAWFLYSTKTQKEIFEPIIADWQKEYFEALSRNEIWKARWIKVRYIYAFLAAMWQKSPIGDLIKFVIKIAR